MHSWLLSMCNYRMADFTDAMCEVTGGRSYAVTSQRVLHQCIDSLVQKLQSGVVINFEKIGQDPPPLPQLKDGDVLAGDGGEEGSPLSRTDTSDTIPLDETDSALFIAKGRYMCLIPI